MRFSFKYIHSLFMLLLLFNSTVALGQVVLSEIMFDPSGSEYYTEFIEICNTSATDTVNLAGWAISDSADSDQLLPVSEDLLLAPGSYGLILDSGYFENSQIYDAIIPESALLITIDDGAFGSQGLSNSRPEPIILLDSLGDTVAFYRYSLDNEPGFSDEKINFEQGDISDNWANSKTELGTPGRPNSVRQLENDIQIILEAVMAHASPNETVSLLMTITNRGLTDATSISVFLFEDKDKDSALTENEHIGEPYFINEILPSGDSTGIAVEIGLLSSGLHLFFAQAEYYNDENITNNSSWAEAKINFPRHSVVINEIMFRPSTGSAEWIELYNPGIESVNLQLWQFSDSHFDDPVTLSKSDIFIDGQNFLVIAEDSTIHYIFQNIPCNVLYPENGFPALNNNGDWIMLSDLTQNVIDEVKYEPSWGSELGFSLERIRSDGNSNDSENWGICQNENGGTPGARNSLAPADFDLSVNLEVEPGLKNSLSLIATIVNNGLKAANQFSCNLYRDFNRDSLAQESEMLISFFNEHQELASEDSTKFTHHFEVSEPGAFFFIAQVIYQSDENPTNNLAFQNFRMPIQKNQLVLNEVMFYPKSGEPEWIEIYNQDSIVINLSGLKLSDSYVEQKHTTCLDDIWIQPESFAIFVASPGLEQIYPQINCPIIVPPTWPVLNNSSDQIVLYDESEAAIDSMAYFSEWEKRVGISYERVDFEISAVDSANWALSTDVSGATPGNLNSVSPFEFDLQISEISFSPTNPFPGDAVEISVLVTNVGKSAMSGFSVSCFADINCDSSLQDDEQIGDPIFISTPIARNEFETIDFIYTPTLPGRFPIYALLSDENDLNAANNSLSKIISVGYSNQSLVINEIMFSPLPDSPEWIEIYNPGSEAINIQNWLISDSDTSYRQILSQNILSIEPGSFLLIAEDSLEASKFLTMDSPQIILNQWPGLNNDLDAVYLFDANQNIIDCIAYSDDWGGSSGISLERINPMHGSADPANWSSCVASAGGTPGTTNSIYVDVIPSETEFTISPNPFSPDSDGRDDVTFINLQLPFNLAQINVKIYDIRGRLVRFLANNQPAGIQSSLIWDGRNDEGHVCRMGIYIVFFEALHHEKGIIKTLKKSVVLAGQL